MGIYLFINLRVDFIRLQMDTEAGQASADWQMGCGGVVGVAAH